jgi:hypothetical protein
MALIGGMIVDGGTDWAHTERFPTLNERSELSWRGWTEAVKPLGPLPHHPRPRGSAARHRCARAPSTLSNSSRGWDAPARMREQ